MSVYRKPNKSPFYLFDFQVGGVRFHGSTKCTNKREADAVERREKEQAKRQLAAQRASSGSLRMDDVAQRYWLEVGTHHAGADNTFRDIGRLVDYFGADTLITEIDDNRVAKLVAWRRGHRVTRGKKQGPLISNATVNRSTTEVLKKLFTRAKLWGVRFDTEPMWLQHMLTEPEERVRELIGDEGDRIDEATRDDYAPLMTFAKETGLRRNECLLRWPEVDWGARQIRKKGKGGKLVVTPITSTIRELLWPLRGHHPEFVFTYVAVRTAQGRVAGQRYPITVEGLKTAWRRCVGKSGVKGFRFHDFRHDIGTKLLRETGNLKVVQKLLNHANIKTTTKYAHVNDQDVADALEELRQSRNKSRTARRKAS